MPHIDLAILAFETEVVQVATVAVAVSAATTMEAVANTVALVDAMTLLTVPVTLVVQFIWISHSQGTNRMSHDPDFVLGEPRSGGREVVLNMSVYTSISICHR